jgi:hypothetical protein
MSFFKKLSSLFSPTNPASKDYYPIAVRCNRCGEKVQARVNMNNDLSIEYDETSGKTTYFCRKVLIGEKQCFQQITVELTFDQDRKLKDRQVFGGEFVN